eukprot:SAG31_NODE_5658_length_2401_cov_1.434405_1_plen_58_part_10
MAVKDEAEILRQVDRYFQMVEDSMNRFNLESKENSDSNQLEGAVSVAFEIAGGQDTGR